jgi:hypothetical protein
MKITLTTTQATDYLRPAFSYNGASALIEYLEQIELITGEEMELDPIGLRCQFSEYETFKEAYLDRFTGVKFRDNKEITEDKAKSYFEENTVTLTFEGGVIIDSEF